MNSTDTAPAAGTEAGQADREPLARAIADAVSASREDLLRLSRTIHELAEVSWEERRSAEAVAGVLEAGGFEVTRGAYGVETALEAVYGTGEMTVVICSEYDALPQIGHGCGHNIIASAGVGAALALRSVADAAGLRVKLLGTPAEEHGGGKVDLLNAGAWEDATFSLMMHGKPDGDVGALSTSMTAVERFEVVYTGREAHAAGAPSEAINAGAAASLSLMNLAVLRQHLPADSNTNAFISDGGAATNVIAGRAVVQAEVRAVELETWRSLKQRVLACFEGAAIATGCSWEHRQTEHPYAPVDTHEGLGRAWDANMERVGRPVETTPVSGGGSTDMGNVSLVVPTVHGMVAVRGSEAVMHHPSFTADALTPEADETIVDGAAVIALTALDAALDPALRAELLEAQAAREPGATRVQLQA